MKQLQAAKNPQNMLLNNPQAKIILDFARERNISLQQIAQLMAQQTHTDLDALVRDLNK